VLPGRGRRTWYLEPAKIQRDLNRFLAYFHLECGYQGYRLRGRTAAQALREALRLDQLPPVVPPASEIETIQAA